MAALHAVDGVLLVVIVGGTALFTMLNDCGGP
jgi:hypothetical protein